jgi:hypothetical protein
MNVAINDAGQRGPSGSIEHLSAARDLDRRILAHCGYAPALDYDRAFLDRVAAKTLDHARADNRCYLVVNWHIGS